MHSLRPEAAGAPAAVAPRDLATRPVLVAATIGTGLMAGLYLAFDVSVMPRLARRDDEAYVTAMRRVNGVLDNSGLFGLLFLGVFLATGLAAVLQRRRERPEAARWTGAATALYAFSVAVTVCVNLPLNRRLARAGSPTGADLAAVRKAFDRPWRSANVARTLACTAALGALGRALVLHGRGAAHGA
ncbi:anthrone oxygenase family protein [Streptomyces liangshanensis]|uniref:anthrone oxygenase family protein n=1 Tax=Streptomyces liangshanensis TaxID=2717324 RepID=UPI0036DD2E76